LQDGNGNDIERSRKPRCGNDGLVDAKAETSSHSRDMSRSLERLDPNDYSAKDFQNKSKRPNDHHEALASPPRVQSQEADDRSFHNHEHNTDKSQISYTQSNIMEDDNDEASVVEIKLIECDYCKRSFAPKVYEKHFDSDGQPKCVSNMDKKRAVFNSAKARIANNSNLNKDEQMQVLQENKKVLKELARKRKGKSKKSKKSNDKWRQESNDFREAMRTNRLISKAEREGKPAHYYL